LHVILPLCWIYSCLLLTNFDVLCPQSGFVVVLKQISEVSAVQENVFDWIAGCKIECRSYEKSVWNKSAELVKCVWWNVWTVSVSDALLFLCEMFMLTYNSNSRELRLFTTGLTFSACLPSITGDEPPTGRRKMDTQTVSVRCSWTRKWLFLSARSFAPGDASSG
jgi:hypothetical protein